MEDYEEALTNRVALTICPSYTVEPTKYGSQRLVKAGKVPESALLDHMTSQFSI